MDDTSVSQLKHPIRGALRDVAIVRHHDDGRTQLAANLVQQTHDLIGSVLVEIAGGLVGEQQWRSVDNGACDRDPLLLTSRELRRAVSSPGLESYATQSLTGESPPIVSVGSLERQRQSNIGLGGQRRKQMKLLEDEAYGLPSVHRPLALGERTLVAAFNQDST